jgi:hypothetical protein
MTAGTAALQKDLSSFKSASQSAAASTDARVHELETTVARLTEELALLQRKQSAAATATAASVDTLSTNLSFTARDVAERGLIMAALGDRLMNEVSQQRVEVQASHARVTEVERKVAAWEFSTAVAARVAGFGINGASAPTASANSKALVPASTTNNNNPLSNQSAIHARKPQGGRFVTRDSVQARPPGTAVFEAAGHELAERQAQQQQAAAALVHHQQHQQPPGHPLSGVIEQHRLEKAAANGDQQAQAQLDAVAADVEAEQSAAGTDEGGWSATDNGSNQTASSSRPSTGALVPIGDSTAASTAAPLSPRAPAAARAFAPLTKLGGVAHVGSGPLPGPPGPQASSSVLPLEPTHFHRYMADYTTRNLQRDLLEIAETYQSTIRHEVDGLRAQLLQLRRQHSEETAKQAAALATAAALASSRETDLRRSVAVLESMLKDRLGELMTRMARVEGQSREVNDNALARAAQLELKYQERNEEIRGALHSLEAQIGAQAPHVKLAPSASLRQGLERDVRVLATQIEHLASAHNERAQALAHDVSRLRTGADDTRRELSTQIQSVHSQMKSLFGDLCSLIDGGSGGGPRSTLHGMLPLLTPPCPGLPSGSGGNVSPAAAAKSIDPKARFLAPSRAMEGSAERRSLSNSAASDRRRAYKSSPRITSDAESEGDEADHGPTSSRGGGHGRESSGDEEKQCGVILSRGFTQPQRLRTTPAVLARSGPSTPTSGRRLLFPEAPTTAPPGNAGGSSNSVGASTGMYLQPQRPSTQQSSRAGASSSDAAFAAAVHASAAGDQSALGLAAQRKDLAARPPSSPHQRAVEHANAAQDASLLRNGAAVAATTGRPRSEVGARVSSSSPPRARHSSAFAVTMPLDGAAAASDGPMLT